MSKPATFVIYITMYIYNLLNKISLTKILEMALLSTKDKFPSNI